MTEKIIGIDKIDRLLELFGSYDENVNAIQKQYGVNIVNRGEEIKITGAEENVRCAIRARG